jgi:hypothetical protein
MRFGIRGAALVALACVVGSCSDNGLGPQRLTSSQATALLNGTPEVGVRISEFHYDNVGTDAGERIEVSAPIGTDMSQWSIVLYNGANGAVYDTDALGTLEQKLCPSGTRFVVFLSYNTDGIQNGAPDGIALVGPASVAAPSGIAEFISYEGVFTVTRNGILVTSKDVGVSETGTTPAGHSIWRNGAGNWNAPRASNFGECNDEPTPPAEVASVTLSPTTATIVVGAKQTFVATALDAAASDAVESVTSSRSSKTALLTSPSM